MLVNLLRMLKHFDGFCKDDAWVVGGMHIFVGWLSGLPCQVR